MGIIDKAAELGFDGIEFADGGWSKNLDLNLAQKIKEHCAEKNLEVVAYCVGANFLGDFDEEVARTKKRRFRGGYGREEYAPRRRLRLHRT